MTTDIPGDPDEYIDVPEDANAVRLEAEKERQLAAIREAAADRGAAGIARMLDAASPVKKRPATKGAGGRKKSVSRIVDELRKALQFTSDDTGTVYLYSDKGGAWRSMSPAHLNAIALNQDAAAGAAKRREIVDRLKASTFAGKIDWGRVGDSEIPCANGILDVTTFSIRAHAAENMLERSLPVAFDAKAEAPTWLKALDVWFPQETDGGRKAALQEFYGYICLAHAKYKRAAVLYGESNTGKSVPVMVAKALVGNDYTCQLSVTDMDDPQRRSVLKGKALNIMTELSANALIADGGFKSLISTEEPVMLDAKYIAAEMYTPTAKHIIATNNLPRLNDHTSATFNRLLIIPFTEEIPERAQDRELLDKLKAELPGILRWAAEGAARLVKRHGQWPVVEASRAILTSYRDEMNPVRQFLSERMVVEKDALTPLREIAHQFNLWNTGSKNFAIKYVGKLLRAAGHGNAIKDARAHGESFDGKTYDGRVLNCLMGFRLVPTITRDLQAGEITGALSEAGNEIVEALISREPGSPSGPAEGI